MFRLIVSVGVGFGAYYLCTRFGVSPLTTGIIMTVFGVAVFAKLG